MASYIVRVVKPMQPFGERKEGPMTAISFTDALHHCAGRLQLAAGEIVRCTRLADEVFKVKLRTAEFIVRTGGGELWFDALHDNTAAGWIKGWAWKRQHWLQRDLER